MYSLIAAIPILVCVVAMIFFNQPATRSLIMAWLLACVVGIFIWGMSFQGAIAQTLAGFLNSLSTIFIIFGAIFLMNTLKQSGAMASISGMFNSITRDIRIQAVLIGFVFAGFVEGSSGFGTPAALCAPILIGLGFPPLAAATICLIYNSTPVNPGPVGVPLITAANVVKDQVIQSGGDFEKFQFLLTRWVCIPNMIGGVFIIFIGVCVLCKVYGKNHSFKDALPALPFCLFSAAVVAVFYLFMAIVIGTPELVSMVGFITALPVLMLAARKGFLMPKDELTFEGYEQWGDKSWQSSVEVSETKSKGMKPFMAWLPYIIIGILLVLTRLNAFGLKDLFNCSELTTKITGILGIENADWKFCWFYNPGIFPFIPIAFLTMLMHHMDGNECKTAIVDSFKQAKGAAIALLFGVAMVQIYRYTSSAAIGATVCQATEYTFKNSSMLYMMARGLATIFSSAYFVVAPLIGVLGAFMSGSCTVSNTLFASLQFETATIVGLPQILIIALQTIGGGIGNMICVNNIVSVCATTGTNGVEGRILKVNIWPCLIYSLIVMIVVGAVILSGFNPMPEMLAQ
ncbi:MAG: L-lactate permease [Atopobiaceae bacterium]